MRLGRTLSRFGSQNPPFVSRCDGTYRRFNVWYAEMRLGRTLSRFGSQNPLRGIQVAPFKIDAISHRRKYGLRGLILSGFRRVRNCDVVRGCASPVVRRKEALIASSRPKRVKSSYKNRRFENERGKRRFPQHSHFQKPLDFKAVSLTTKPHFLLALPPHDA